MGSSLLEDEPMRRTRGIKGIKNFLDVTAYNTGWHTYLGNHDCGFMDLNVYEIAVELTTRYGRRVEFTGFQGNTITFQGV